jgi:acyl-CoA thioesterase-1
VNRFVILLIFAFAPLAGRADPATILVFGDSISAGYGLPSVARGWVALLQTKLDKAGYGYHVVNASVSGETTAGGLARLPRALGLHHPQIVMLELGGNDGLRALPVADMRANLAAMVRLAKDSGAAVLLLGIRIPPNYGPDYTEQFFNSYAILGKELRVPVVPFLLDGIALSPELMQADGIHPNEQGQGKLVANVWTALQPLLVNSSGAAHPK